MDPEDGDIWVMIVGQNQAGFTLSFAPSDATVVDAEFKAMPNLDDEGTLVEYVEEILNDTEAYSVEQNLTNVTSTFSGDSVNEGERLTMILTAADGYTIQTPTITMSGQDVTGTAWNSANNTVTIESVTGDVVITAAATA